MNRRSFLAALGIAPMAAVLPAVARENAPVSNGVLCRADQFVVEPGEIVPFEDRVFCFTRISSFGGSLTLRANDDVGLIELWADKL